MRYVILDDLSVGEVAEPTPTHRLKVLAVDPYRGNAREREIAGT